MRTCRSLILVFTLLLIFPAWAQEESKISLELRYFLEQQRADQMVPLLVEGKNEAFEEAIKRNGGQIRLQVEQMYSISIPAEQVAELSKDTNLLKIEFSNAPAHFLNDTMLIQTRADQVQSMVAPLREEYKGKGVLLGVIDSGIELAHPDFQDSLGNTRVLHVWDQGVPYNSAYKPGTYSYGVEWDSTEINNQVSTHDDKASQFGHGSMVSGVAASNGLATGNFKGIAPEVNIVSVATDFSKPNWLQTVAEAVDYIFAKADSLGMPCVINASIGTYVGSHDGEDIAARMIDQMIKAKSGRALVAAAGNAGAFNFHLQHRPQNDTQFTWFEHANLFFNGQGGLYFRMWSDTADMKDLKFSIGADRRQGSFFEFRGRTAFDSIQNRLNVIYTDSIMGANQNRIAYVQTYAEQSRGRYLLEIAIPQPDSAQYLFRLETAGVGKVDLWSFLPLTGTSNMLDQNLPSQASFPAIRNYVVPDSLQTIVSSFTCLPSVITVGNYVNQSSWLDVNQQNQYVNVVPGQISINSSLGPNRRGVLKPDLSSAGDYMFSAGRLATMQVAIQNEPFKVAFDSLHMRNGGTSMAAPTVAGMIALYMEQCSGADYARIKQDLLQTSRTDQYSVSAPNPKWGLGKADALAFLSQNVFSPQINTILPNLCEGDTVPLSTSSAYLSYQWNNGDTTQTSLITDSSLVYVQVQDSLCRSVSDTLQFQFNENPPKPNLLQRNDSLVSNVAGNYRWFLNGSLIPSQTDSILVVSQNGDYHAEVNNAFGCISRSDTITYLSTSLETSTIKAYKIYPNPTEDRLFIELQKDFKEVKVFNLQGREVFYRNSARSGQLFELEFGLLDKGIYLIEFLGEEKNFREKVIKW